MDTVVVIEQRQYEALRDILNTIVTSQQLSLMLSPLSDVMNQAALNSIKEIAAAALNICPVCCKNHYPICKRC